MGWSYRAGSVRGAPDVLGGFPLLENFRGGEVAGDERRAVRAVVLGGDVEAAVLGEHLARGELEHGGVRDGGHATQRGHLTLRLTRGLPDRRADVADAAGLAHLVRQREPRHLRLGVFLERRGVCASRLSELPLGGGIAVGGK